MRFTKIEAQHFPNNVVSIFIDELYKNQCDFYRACAHEYKSVAENEFELRMQTLVALTR